jgi:hypothetical protein
MDSQPPASDYRGGITLFVAIFTFTVAAAVVALRVVTRGFIIRQFGLDDALAVFALGLVFGCDFAVTYSKWDSQRPAHGKKMVAE